MRRVKQILVLVKRLLMGIFLAHTLYATCLMAETQKASLADVLEGVQHESSQGHPTFLGAGLRDVLRDFVLLQTKLFDWDTLKVFVGTIPLFVGSRMIDEKIQSTFYDRKHHKNIRQMHNACYEFAKSCLAIPIVLLGSGVIWAKDENFRETSRVFLIGMPFVIWSKELIKKWRIDCSKRPWNEKYSRTKQCYGGFPSGHMAEIVYSTVLFGKRLGPKVGIPLGCISLFLGVNFVSTNRHYLSQIIAGSSLGVIYALAADKLISSNLERRHPIDFGIGLNEQGKLELQVGVSF